MLLLPAAAAPTSARTVVAFLAAHVEVGIEAGGAA
jgi:hypothetical protein